MRITRTRLALFAAAAAAAFAVAVAVSHTRQGGQARSAAQAAAEQARDAITRARTLLASDPGAALAQAHQIGNADPEEVRAIELEAAAAGYTEKISPGPDREAGRGASGDGQGAAAAAREAVSADGALRASLSPNGLLQLTEVRSGDLLELRGQERPVRTLRFDGAALITSDGTETRRWRATIPARTVLRGHARGPCALGAAAEGALASSCADGSMRLWNERGERRALTEPGLAGGLLAISADGKSLFGNGTDGAIFQWDPSTGAARAFGDRAGPLSTLALVGDARLVATAGPDALVRLCGVQSGRCRLLSGNAGPARALAFSQEGATLASVGDEPLLRIWEVDTPRVHPLELEAGGRDLSFSPDGALLAIAGAGGVVDIVDGRTVARRPLRGHAGPVVRVAFAPDGAHLASASLDGTVRLWSLASGEALVLRHRATARALAFSPSGTRLLTAADDGAARVWDAKSGALLHVLRGGPAPLTSAVWLQDGALAATAAADGILRLFPLSAAPAGQAARGPGSP